MAATAATDAELAAAVATINNSLTGKQDAATAATDAELATGLLTKANRDLRWKANTDYKAGEIAINGSLVYMANADFTSGAVFNPANWTLVNPNEIASMTYATVTGFTTTWTAAPGWQIVIPANSGPATIRLANLLLALVTGTLANSATLYGEIKVQDELGVTVAYGKVAAYGSNAGVSQTLVETMSIEADVPNNAVAKTYTVYLRCNTVASSSTVTMHSSGSGFVDPQLKATRR
jgi:hypothetical protein